MTGVDEFFEELRREYLTEAPMRLAELRKDLAALRVGEPDAAASLKARFHRLAGSGGSYGFPEISETSRAAERWILEHPAPDADGLAHLDAAIAKVGKAFDEAARTLGLPAEPTRRPPFSWQALVLGEDGPLVERVERALADAQYATARRPLAEAPAGLPVTERPDIAVLVPSDSPDLEGIVARWTAAGSSRPASVLLIAAPGAIDPLAPPFASLDYVVPPDRVETELLAFVRAIGRSANAPPVVVVADPDEQQAAALRTALESAGARVQVASGGAALRELLERENPDLVLVEWRLPDTTGPALLRYVRFGSGHHSTPIVVHTAQLSDDDRVAAIRAGADDVLLKSVPRTQLVKTLLARVERSRQQRALAHRDDLTGLLNHSSMVEELEAAVSFAQRTDEQFGLIVIDLDHFRRVNELFGYQVGDQLLAGVARAVGGTIRSSDFASRLGGEEIGVLVRRCSLDNALALADKLRRVAGEFRVEVGEQRVGTKVSAGVACYPDHGRTAHELLRAADRALAGAKASGRDRVGGAP